MKHEVSNQKEWKIYSNTVVMHFYAKHVLLASGLYKKNIYE